VNSRLCVRNPLPFSGAGFLAGVSLSAGAQTLRIMEQTQESDDPHGFNDHWDPMAPLAGRSPDFVVIARMAISNLHLQRVSLFSMRSRPLTVRRSADISSRNTDLVYGLAQESTIEFPRITALDISYSQ
jgi:hypothetical protein